MCDSCLACFITVSGQVCHWQQNWNFAESLVIDLANVGVEQRIQHFQNITKSPCCIRLGC